MKASITIEIRCINDSWVNPLQKNDSKINKNFYIIKNPYLEMISYILLLGVLVNFAKFFSQSTLPKESSCIT